MPKASKLRSLAEGSSALKATNDKEPYYPSLGLSEESMPELADHEVGDTVTLTVEAKISGINKYGNGEIHYTLELRKGKITDGSINNEGEE